MAASMGGEAKLVAVIGDEDTVMGLLLAGIGHRDSVGRQNFMIVGAETGQHAIETFFDDIVNREVRCVFCSTPRWCMQEFRGGGGGECVSFAEMRCDIQHR
jgi:hypothetical protein